MGSLPISLLCSGWFTAAPHNVSSVVSACLETLSQLRKKKTNLLITAARCQRLLLLPYSDQQHFSLSPFPMG